MINTFFHRWKWIPLVTAVYATCGVAANGIGVVVVQVAPHSGAAAAGLVAGDVLAGWSTPEHSGSFASPYDLVQVEIENTPRAIVAIAGTRNEHPLTWKLGEAAWGISAEPLLTKELQDYLSGGPSDDIARRYEHAATQNQVSNPVLAGWLFGEAAAMFAKKASWISADRAYGNALSVTEKVAPSAAAQILAAWAQTYRTRGDIASAGTKLDAAIQQLRRGGSPLGLAHILMAAGRFAYSREDFTAAQKCFEEALQLRESAAPNSVATYEPLIQLGMIERRRGNFEIADRHLRKAIEQLAAIAPESIEFASALSGLGVLEMDQGKFPGARESLGKALTILQRTAPGSAQLARTLNDMGLLLQNLGDMLEAEAKFLAALAINQQIASNSIEVARNLSNLGCVTNERGDVAKGEDYLLRALQIQTRLAPGSYSVGISLANLGAVARDRWDLAGAEDYDRRALAIFERVAPASPVLPGLELNLGDIALERGNYDSAERYFRRALARQQKSAPESPDVAVTMHALAIVAKRRGDLDGAQHTYQRVLALQQKLAPGGLDIASSFHDLAEIEEEKGEVSQSEAHYHRALEIRSKLSPGSRIEAESLCGLARIAQQKGDRASAARNYEAGLAALESQTNRLGGAEELRASFAARNARFYRDYMEMLVADGKIEQGFHILERSRARDLLRMIAERDLVFPSEIPPELQKTLRANAVEYDQVQTRISSLDPKAESADVDVQLRRLRELTAERARIEDQVKRASPRLAGLKYPKPLDAFEAAAALDPGTLLLSYAVGEKHTVLFALSLESGQPQLRHFVLPVRERTLRTRIELFTKQITNPTGDSAKLRATAVRLYDDLLRPVESLIESADRIAIIPDGALHVLPFAALVRGNQYLIEWKPIHTALSATVYAELRAKRAGTYATDRALIAFGDPQMPNWNREQLRQARDGALRMASKRGLTLAPLPFSRTEVEAIANRFEGRSQVFLGKQATETAAKSLSPGFRYLHFATHGIFDERIPLNSAIVLSVPKASGQPVENGLLQAWEIIENARWDADLVVLSACRTALGRELTGEGLVGLTRAIEFAGARSTIASLWNVDDRRTAILMDHFYSKLRAGASKDEALREAQLEMLHSRASRPFYWAAFTLNGDCR